MPNRDLNALWFLFGAWLVVMFWWFFGMAA
jgi:hypothetical protein